MQRKAALAVTRLKAWWNRPVIRKRLRFIGIFLLLAGVVWSISTAEIAWRDLSWPHLALDAFVLTPALLFVAALTFRVTAASAGAHVTLAQALATVAHANVAELLPLPGGAIVRGAALVNAGARIGAATQLVLLTALLTLGLTVALSSGALAILDHIAWAWLAAACLIGVAIVLWLLSRHAHPRYLVWMVVLRIVSLGITAARLVLAFAALGQSITFLEGALYAVAPTLGAAVGIFPAGLGLNEAVAAGLATLIASSAATAFLAVALNRLLGLGVGAVLVFAQELIRKRRAG